MHGLDLDQEQAHILRKMKTPLLETLNLADNFIAGLEYFDWISAALVHLKSLDLSQNSLTDEAVCYLTRMKFPELSDINIANNRKLTAHSLECLAQYNLTMLTHLDISHNLASEKSLRKLFGGRKLQNLEVFKMVNVMRAAKLFEFLDWRSMRKLRVFDLMDTDLSKSIDFIVSKKVNFSTLKQWRFGGQWMNRSSMDLMLKNLTAFGPQLQLFQAMVGSQMSRGGYINVSSLEYSTVPFGAYIISKGKMTVFKHWQTDKLEVIELKAPPSSQSSQTMGFLSEMYHYSYFGFRFLNEESFNEESILQDRNLFFQVSKQLGEKVNFERMQVFTYVYPSDYSLIYNIWMRYHPFDAFRFFTQVAVFLQLNKPFEQTINLPYLRHMTYLPSGIFYDKSQFLYYYNQIKSPFFDNIMIGSQPLRDHPNVYKFINLLLRRNPNINILYLINTQISCQILQLIFSDVHLPFLNHFYINDNELSVQCLSNFFNQHNLIRYLNIGLNFNLSTVVTHTLMKQDLILQTFQIQGVQLGNQEFSQIAFINTQFLLQFQADQTKINQDGIIWLMGNKTGPIFPKMFLLSLKNNFYNQSGITSLFSKGMPFLSKIFFSYLENPNISAKILSYPTQLDFFAQQKGDIKSLQTSINPKALRHATTFNLDVKDFSTKDFEILSKMDLIRLQTVNLQIYNVKECQILMYVLKILKNVEHFSLSIKNIKSRDKPLNDNCLETYSPSQGSYFKRLHTQNVQFPKEKFYLPNLFSIIFGNFIVQKDEINLSNHYFTDDVMISLFVNPITDQVVQLTFNRNYLTDAFVEKIFHKSVQNIVSINFHRNQIQLINVPVLIGKKFPKLKKLDFGKNEITDKGIDLLVQAYFPELQQLSLESCDISLEGFIKLLELRAPKLKILNLQNTLITEWDLVYMAEYVDLDGFPANLQIMTKLEILQTNRERLDKLLMEKYGVLSVDIKYESKHLKEKNKAVMEED